MNTPRTDALMFTAGRMVNATEGERFVAMRDALQAGIEELETELAQARAEVKRLSALAAAAPAPEPAGRLKLNGNQFVFGLNEPRPADGTYDVYLNTTPPDLPAAPAPEPMAWMYMHEETGNTSVYLLQRKNMSRYVEVPLYTARSANLAATPPNHSEDVRGMVAAPAPEPVAWASPNVIPLTGMRDNFPCVLTPFRCEANTVPLYTTPPDLSARVRELESALRECEEYLRDCANSPVLAERICHILMGAKQ